MVAALCARHEPGVVTKTASHVLDGAANRIASVQRALRSAQHFDAIYVQNVEHCTLRTRVIVIVDVPPHAGFEPPERILLPNPANEGRERRIRAARDLKREAGCSALQVG